MKILPKSAYETKKQFFGKRGWTAYLAGKTNAINQRDSSYHSSIYKKRK
jgi:hypothetical protein